jgi:capsular polysaccharide biosynthesis protein
MELRHYLREVWAYKFGILAAVVVTALIVFLVTNSSPKVYTAESRLVVTAGLGSDGSDTDDVEAAPRLGQTYAVLAGTRPILQEVIDRAELPYDVAELSPRVSTVASLDTPFLSITVEDGDPELAALTANTMAEVLVERGTIAAVPATENDPGRPEIRLLAAVEEATVPDDPSAPRVLFSTALSAAAALAACLVLLALVVYIRADEPMGRDVARA